MSDWLTIDTAPRDGSYVQLKFGDGETSEADDDGAYVGAWVNDGWWDRTGSDYGYGASQPTHWRP